MKIGLVLFVLILSFVTLGSTTEQSLNAQEQKMARELAKTAKEFLQTPVPTTGEEALDQILRETWQQAQRELRIVLGHPQIQSPLEHSTPP